MTRAKLELDPGALIWNGSYPLEQGETYQGKFTIKRHAVQCHTRQRKRQEKAAMKVRKRLTRVA